MSNGTLIGGSTTLSGDVSADEDIQVLGRVEGTLATSGDLTVALEAVVMADVTARRVLVQGALVGEVQASELVEIGGDARVSGNITAPRISVEEGAQVSGSINMGGGSAPARKPAPAEVEEKKPAPAKKRPAPAKKRPAPAKKSPAPAKKKAAPAKKKPAPAKKKAAPKKKKAAPKKKKAPPKPPTAPGKKVRPRRKK